jgi:hypothetical protein
VKFGGWQQLTSEYAKQFGIETLNWSPQAAQKRESRGSQNIAPTTLAEATMNTATQRSIFRWIHLIFSIPILGYIYSPFEKLPGYAPTTRFVFLPVMILSGLWMWKGHVLRRLVSKGSGQ